MSKSKTPLFMAEILAFSHWVDVVSFFQDVEHLDDFSGVNLSSAGPVIRQMHEIYVATGARFPSYANFQSTLELCDQFLMGRVDPEFFARVYAQACQDGSAILPYNKVFVELDPANDQGIPAGIDAFRYPFLILGYITRNIEPQTGLVIGIRPKQRKMLREAIELMDDNTPSGFSPRGPVLS